MRYDGQYLYFVLPISVCAWTDRSAYSEPVLVAEIECRQEIEVIQKEGDWDWVTRQLHLDDIATRKWVVLEPHHLGMAGLLLEEAAKFIKGNWREIEELILEAEPDVRKMEAANNPARLEKRELV